METNLSVGNQVISGNPTPWWHGHVPMFILLLYACIRASEVVRNFLFLLDYTTVYPLQ